ncbi:MAG: DUF3089 domain-containing protein [Oleiphilaceae bacterium]|nr:DUF3089 domain-containing protein [Oleiphilaceae bacterium]
MTVVAAAILVGSGCTEDTADTRTGVTEPATAAAANPAGQSPGQRPFQRQNPYDGYESVNYGGLDNWLCHPDQAYEDNICHTNLDTLSVDASGNSQLLPFSTGEDRGIDCFYVYPTASADPFPNSDFQPDLQEIEVTKLQAGRYGEVCELFAPVYRQRTLTLLAVRGALANVYPRSEALDALLAPLNQPPLSESELGKLLTPTETTETTLSDINSEADALAYADVLDAFRAFVAGRDTDRGFLLLGHSQGSRILARLIAEEIEPEPALRERLVAAHIPGTDIEVPVGADVGGRFARTPACRHSDETGCVIGYASYRAGDPELADPRFGTTADGNTEAMCVNPAALSGGTGSLQVRLPYRLPPVYEVLLIPRGSGGPYANPLENVSARLEAPFFAVPGQIRGQCQRTDQGAHYLEVVIEANPEDARADDYPGEFIGGSNWGLHLADVNLAQGNLVDLARSQSSTWLDQQFCGKTRGNPDRFCDQ